MRHYEQGAARKHPGAIGFKVFARRAKTDDSELLDRAEVPRRSVGWVVTDTDCRVVDEAIRRHRQIVGRRDTGKHAAGRIVFRAMARAEIAAGPGGHWR